jgi:hypothetical protein
MVQLASRALYCLDISLPHGLVVLLLINTGVPRFHSSFCSRAITPGLVDLNLDGIAASF